MKTTLNIDDGVMRRLSEKAARQGRTVSELVEAGLCLVLAEERRQPPPLPPLPDWSTGGARVDVADRESLYGIRASR